MSITSVAGQEPQITEGSYEGFRYEIYSSNSATATLKIYIPDGQCIKATPGCMLATSSNIEITAKLNKVLNAKSTMTAKDGEGWVILAPGCFGSITPVKVSDDPLCLGDNSFLACLGDVESESKTQSAGKTFFSGHGLFVKQVSGSGIVFVTSVGSMMTLEIPDGESAVLDNGHLVTWPASANYEFQKAAKSWWRSGLSGEGVVAKITGPAQLNVQTKSADEVASWIYSSKSPPRQG